VGFGDPVAIIINAIFLAPAIALAIPLHEWAHARVAVACGDLMPRLDGRLSINPARQLDPLGTVVALFTGFGWGKPVRINPARMRTRLDPALVAAAGPITNLLIAVVLAIPLRLAYANGVGIGAQPSFVQAPINILIEFVVVAFLFNVVVAVLNVLPLPPLDGYAFASALLRRRLPKVFAWIGARSGTIGIVLLLLLFIPLTRAPVFALIYVAASRWLLGT
jgi:Zn-dependent protease